ncbi:MAG: response regulator [Planctomycetes bacterium]|nr:response regulator [Planctomycetota bacterium]
MAKLLVVEDSESQARLIQALLQIGGHEVGLACNGREGLQQAVDGNPQLVLTDLQMPEMNGLELVEAMRHQCPSIPVVLMTAFGSDDIAVEALKRGAASYVPKRRLAQDLLRTVNGLLAVAQMRHPDQLMQYLQQAEAIFQLDNEVESVPALTNYIQNMVMEIHQCGDNTAMRLGVAIHEALVNAIYHGNLQVSSELREGSGDAFDKLVAERRQIEPYAQRRVTVVARVSRTETVIAVRDEGDGFDPAIVPDPSESANLEKLSGRGLFLIRTFLDEVRYNSRGNEITMVKRRELLTSSRN